MPEYERSNPATEAPDREAAPEKKPETEAGPQDTVGNSAVADGTPPAPTGGGTPTLDAAEGTFGDAVPSWAEDAVAATGLPLVDPSVPTTTGEPPRELPPVSVGLATVVSAGDPAVVATYLQTAVFSGNDDEVLALAASMPDLIATLPPEQQRVVGEALQNLGTQWDALGPDVNPDAYARMQLVGQEWYHEQGVLGNDPYGVDTTQSLSVNSEHYDPSLMEDRDGVHTDMQIPGIFWTEQGNLGRYLDTQGLLYVGEDGLRIMRRDGSENVTALELEAMADVAFFGPGSVTLEDGTPAAVMRDATTGEVQYVVRGPNGIQVVSEDGLPSPITQQAEAVTNATRVAGEEVEVTQTNGADGSNMVGAAFSGGLAGNENAGFTIDQSAAQQGGNVYGLVATGDTLTGGDFTIQQNVMGVGDSQYHIGEDGTVEVAGQWGAVLDGDLADTSIAVGGETPGPILVNGNVGPGTELSGSTVIVHGTIDPGATVTADTVLVVGEDGTTQRWDPETRELVAWDGDTMRQEDPLAFQDSLKLSNGEIDVSASTTTNASSAGLHGEGFQANTTQTETDGNGNTAATTWQLGLGNGQLTGSLERVVTQNGNQASGSGSVSIDPTTGAVTVASQGGYRWGKDGPQVTGNVSFGWQDGQVTGADASVGGNYGGAGITVSAGVEDHDFAVFDGGSSATGDEVVTYGQVDDWSVGAGGKIPAGPLTIGVNGEIERGHTTQAYADLDHLTGIDPALATTDPAAFREAVAAQMASRLDGVSSISDVEAKDLATWQVGDGLILESSGTDTLGGSLGVGVGPIDASLGLSHAEGRTEQTQVELIEDDPRTVAVTVTNVDSETWNASLNGGPLGLSSEQTGANGASVSFQIDVSTPAGQAAFEAYRETQILPGALAYAQACGTLPANLDVKDPAQLRALAGQINGQWMQSPTFALGATGDGATSYTNHVLDRTERQEEALSAFGFDLLSHELVESWKDRLYLENGGQETERSYNRSESAWFSNDSETTGIVLNPEHGTLPDGTVVEASLFAQENLGQVLPSDLDPDLLAAIPEDRVDPLTRAWLAGEITDGSYDAVMSMGLSLTDDQMTALDLALDAPGQANTDRTARLDEAVTGTIDDTLASLGMERVVADDGSVTFEITDTWRYQTLQNNAIAGGEQYDEQDYRAEVLGQTLQAVGVDQEALDARAAEIASLGHVSFEEAQLQVYESSLNAMADVKGDDAAFQQLDPALQTAFVETAAEHLENPWDVLDLALEVPAGDARDELLRTTFATIEGREGGNNAVASFYDWTGGLDEQLRNNVRSSLVVNVYDRGTMDRMAEMSQREAEVDQSAIDGFLLDYELNPGDPINVMNNDAQNAIVTDLVAATELARAGDPAYLASMLEGLSASDRGMGDPRTDNLGVMFAAMRDPALQAIYLDALSTMDAATAQGAAPTTYTQQALDWVAAHPTSVVNALGEGTPETQSALLTRLTDAGVDVNTVLTEGGAQAVAAVVASFSEGDGYVDQERAGVAAVLQQLSDDPALLQTFTDTVLATPGLAEASERVGGGGDPVGALLATLAVDDAGAGLVVVEALLGTSHADEAKAALLENPDLVFSEGYGSGGQQALEVMQRLREMNVDPMPVLEALLAQNGQTNPEILQGIDPTDAAALGDLLADREQEHGVFGLDWNPDTASLSSILLVAADRGPEFVTDVVAAYEGSGHRPGDDGITNLLDAMSHGGSAQVALAAEALRTAGYDAEVAAWLAEHGGEVALEPGQG